MSIPVIDVFAGAGGLGDGFASLGAGRTTPFEVSLSIEQDSAACRTLRLRKFFRLVRSDSQRADYYRTVRGEISEQALYELHPALARRAGNAVWQATLGSDTAPKEIRDEQISRALQNKRDWVLLGGPPCQAYSIAGRVRNRGVTGYVAEQDNRHYLYREYLQIIAAHWPAVFIMENVRGILSARVNGQPIFKRILDDLADPAAAVGRRVSDGFEGGYKYRLLALTGDAEKKDLFGEDITRLDDFLVQGENHGLPQTRHRVLVLGIRDDITSDPRALEELEPISAGQVLHELPRLLRGLTSGEDSDDRWLETLRTAAQEKWTRNAVGDLADVVAAMRLVAEQARVPRAGRGGAFVKDTRKAATPPKDGQLAELLGFLRDPVLGGWANHESRGHMPSDIARYLFASCFARESGESPRLKDFPAALLPDHNNVDKNRGSSEFADRFRVQLPDQAAGTVVSHIAKDGHAFIHHDPTQCRALTVREAARLQTFPDNYFFCGNRTEQYVQVGNAVPPFLARSIAKIVHQLLTDRDPKTRPRPAVTAGRRATP